MPEKPKSLKSFLNSTSKLKTERSSKKNKDLTISPEDFKKIQKKAYELYLERGCHEGYADQDWQKAQSIVLAQKVSDVHV